MNLRAIDERSPGSSCYCWYEPGQYFGHAQGQAPARGRGIQPDLEHPILAIGSPAPGFRPAGRGRQDSQAQRLREREDPGDCVRVQSLSGVAALRRAASRSSTRTTRTRASRSSRSIPTTPKSIRLNELGYTDVTDSLAEMKIRDGVPAHRLAVSLRRRNAGRVDQVRRRRHAAHLSLRSGTQAAVSGTHRRQPARGSRQVTGCAQRDRRDAGGSARSGHRNARVRLHDEVDVEGHRRRGGVGEDSGRARHGRHGRRGRSEEAARERDRQGRCS